MNILVTGSEGQIGWELLRALKATLHHVIGMGREHMDLADPDSIRRTIRNHKPNLIINAAGYTAVDRAESEPELAMAVNAIAPGIIGEEAAKLGAAVIHYSTDYVFDGTKRSPYLPGDVPNPLSAYGRSKVEGERALLQSGASALVLRTSWVYAARGKNFLLTILDLAASQPELRIVNDQIGSPTSAREIARATLAMISCGLRMEANTATFGSRAGLHHLAAQGETSWFEFARTALPLAKVSPMPRLVAIPSSQFPAAAQRPLYSVLNCESTFTTFNVLMADWRTGLEDVIRERAACAARNASPTPSAEVHDESLQPIATATKARPNR